MQKPPLLPNQLPDFSFELRARRRGYHLIAGVDEAGRGPLAGPVVAAACILPEEVAISGINDSKKLTPLQRYQLYETLINHPEVAYGVGVVDALRIDQINILQAAFEAMLIAIDHLRKKQQPDCLCKADCLCKKQQPDYLLIDGSLLPPKLTLSAECIIGGDGMSRSIAAASIIAKETRDRLMVDYHKKWPHYQFKQHKGYATEEHRRLIALHGPSPIHRLSFSPFTDKK